MTQPSLLDVMSAADAPQTPSVPENTAPPAQEYVAPIVDNTPAPQPELPAATIPGSADHVAWFQQNVMPIPDLNDPEELAANLKDLIGTHVGATEVLGGDFTLDGLKALKARADRAAELEMQLAQPKPPEAPAATVEAAIDQKWEALNLPGDWRSLVVEENGRYKAAVPDSPTSQQAAKLVGQALDRWQREISPYLMSDPTGFVGTAAQPIIAKLEKKWEDRFKAMEQFQQQHAQQTAGEREWNEFYLQNGSKLHVFNPQTGQLDATPMGEVFNQDYQDFVKTMPPEQARQLAMRNAEKYGGAAAPAAPAPAAPAAPKSPFARRPAARAARPTDATNPPRNDNLDNFENFADAESLRRSLTSEINGR